MINAKNKKRPNFQSNIDMLDAFFSSLAPFDIIMSKYFRNNKWIGSTERREIAERSYSIFRNYELIKFYTKNITENFGRFFVLSFLKIIEKRSDEKIIDIFSGSNYYPSKITDFERKFLLSLNIKKELPLNVELNYPSWMNNYLLQAFSNDEDQLRNEMIAMNKKASVDLRINTLKISKSDAIEKLRKDNFQCEETKYSKIGIRILNSRIGRNNELLSNGFLEIQDEGSQLIAEICGTTSESVVVDFCAGAGGKTLAISAFMNNKGRIFALDKYPERLENAKKRFRRAGVNNVFCQEITSKWLKRHYECADIVLVDAPCSGTGTWRRNPDMRAKFSLNDLEELIVVQSSILESASNLVKKGGKLVYATCSILLKENEEQITKFIEKYPEFSLKKIDYDFASDSGFLKLSPFRNGTDGFFAAVLEKE